MKSLNTLTADNAGFTLIEILFVIGLFLALSTLSVLMSVKHLQQATLRQERDTLISLLWDARAQALANVQEVSHGVHITDTDFISFSGDTFDERETSPHIVPHAQGLLVSGSTTVIFEPLTGEVHEGNALITLSKEHEEVSLFINALGRIEW